MKRLNVVEMYASLDEDECDATRKYRRYLLGVIRERFARQPRCDEDLTKTQRTPLSSPDEQQHRLPR